jgi:hypothetical protein
MQAIEQSISLPNFAEREAGTDSHLELPESPVRGARFWLCCPKDPKNLGTGSLLSNVSWCCVSKSVIP